MNRRVRNRTHGGVGGRREQSRLLPDIRALKGFRGKEAPVVILLWTAVSASGVIEDVTLQKNESQVEGVNLAFGQ
jgi:hypothetical protein